MIWQGVRWTLWLSEYPDAERRVQGSRFCNRSGFRASVLRERNSRRVPARCTEKRRLKPWSPEWKRRERFFERGNYRFVWSPWSRAGLQETDRDIGHIPGVRQARREPNRDHCISSPSFISLFLSPSSPLPVLPFLFNISATQGPPRTTLVACRNIHYPRCRVNSAESKIDFELFYLTWIVTFCRNQLIMRP